MPSNLTLLRILQVTAHQLQCLTCEAIVLALGHGMGFTPEILRVMSDTGKYFQVVWALLEAGAEQQMLIRS